MRVIPSAAQREPVPDLTSSSIPGCTPKTSGGLCFRRAHPLGRITVSVLWWVVRAHLVADRLPIGRRERNYFIIREHSRCSSINVARFSVF